MRLHVHEWGNAAAPPVVCVHGVSAHGRRYRRLAEERLAARFHVLAPDLRGHGLSEHDPPWDLATNVADLLETLDEEGITAPAWVGHSFGARLVLELAAARPERIRCAVLLDPAIQILPHVGYDFAQEAAKDHSFTSVDEAIAARLTTSVLTPREFLEEEAHEHLVPSSDGRLRWQCSRAAVATVYSELCREPPPPTVLEGIPSQLVHAEQFGLVREEQLEEYERSLGDGLELVAVPGGHIVYWDAFEETADAVEKFLIRHASVSHP
ncbi:MAG TPA: alpha/beta hydrolase [Gaiellaceae bacterium]|nr:alpha/beta hydrolase [Gaiellaceae bacterium]